MGNPPSASTIEVAYSKSGEESPATFEGASEAMSLLLRAKEGEQYLTALQILERNPTAH